MNSGLSYGRPTEKKNSVKYCSEGFQGIDQSESMVLWIRGEKMCSGMDRFIISLNKRRMWSWWWIFGFPLNSRNLLHRRIDGARKGLRSLELLKNNSMFLNFNENSAFILLACHCNWTLSIVWSTHDIPRTRRFRNWLYLPTLDTTIYFFSIVSNPQVKMGLSWGVLVLY
jgi:hypothetical protein